jgi:hypothetical protein
MERAMLSIITQNEELLRELKAEQEVQKEKLQNIMDTVDSLMDFVDTTREEL